MRFIGFSTVLAAMVAFGAGASDAATLGLMTESDTDASAGAEVAINTYESLLDAVISAPASSKLTNIDVNSSFSTSGITWDGNQYVVMLESDQDATSGLELGFLTYASFESILQNSVSGQFLSSIDVDPDFSTTGIAWDGTQFIVMLESDLDAASGAELKFNTYASFQDILSDNPSSSAFSVLSLTAAYSTTGLTWDGSEFVVMIESDADAVAGAELAFYRFGSFADLLTNLPAGSQNSSIDWVAGFSSTGLYTAPSQVPLPASAGLLLAALGGMGFAGFRTKRRTSAGIQS